MASSLATWLTYFSSLICFLLMTFMPQRKPVALWMTSITSPNCPFPSFFPTAKSSFVNCLG